MHIRRILAIASIVFIMACILGFIFFPGTSIGIEGFRTESDDGCINLYWNLRSAGGQFNPAVKTVITITGENTEKTVSLDSEETTYSFSDGASGKGYDFSIHLEKFGIPMCQPQTKRALFIDYSDVPDCPLIVIETDNHKDPTCDYVYAPNEYCAGTGITNNYYVCGTICIYEEKEINYSSTLSIKVRGNTSALSEKKPYKIKLDEAADLLNRGEEYAYSEWLLINFENVNTAVGTYVATLCGIEWQPEFRCVNLILNGDWKGSYLLIETVDAGKNKIDITEDGFIIENDAYWWNSDGEYFKSDVQNTVYAENGGMGYTFRYPSYNSLSEAERNKIIDAVNKAESKLFSSDGDYLDYIDIESISSWLLAQDVLGNEDSCGSNIFLFSTEMEKPYGQAKISIGPLWDTDGIYSQEGTWSEVHNSFYFIELLNKTDFLKKYTEKFLNIENIDFHNLDSCVVKYCGTSELAIECSWKYDMVRWNADIESLKSQIEHAEEYIEGRLYWITDSLTEISKNRKADICVSKNPDNSFTIEYYAKENLNRVRIPVWSDIDGQDDIVWYDAENISDNIWNVMVFTENHSGDGCYVIHVYGTGSNGNEEFISGRTYTVVSEGNYKGHTDNEN